MLHHLIFDATDNDTIQDSHNVGAFLRSDEAGALISHHGYVEPGVVSFDFVDGDVTVGTDSIAETAHGLNTGDRVRLTTTGTLPSPLAVATDYYVIRIDADNFKLATSPKNAQLGIAIDIASAAGGGTHTITEQEKDGRALDVFVVTPIEINLTQDDEVTVFQGTDPWIVSATDFDIRDLTHVSDSVSIGDGTDLLAINADGSINITDNGGSLTVDATDLDIRDLTQADEVTVFQGTDPWIVSATDFDIRDLTHVSDSVALGDGTNLLTSTTVGADIGLDVYNLNDPAIANVDALAQRKLLTAGGTEEDLLATQLPNRKMLYIMNNDNRMMYIGLSGDSTDETSGWPIPPGSYMPLKAGSALSFEYVSNKTNHDARLLEMS